MILMFPVRFQKTLRPTSLARFLCRRGSFPDRGYDPVEADPSRGEGYTGIPSLLESNLPPKTSFAIGWNQEYLIILFKILPIHSSNPPPCPALVQGRRKPQVFFQYPSYAFSKSYGHPQLSGTYTWERLELERHNPSHILPLLHLSEFCLKPHFVQCFGHKLSDFTGGAAFVA